MLAQTLNAITLRFQNIRRGGRDPLGDLMLDPLRPLSGILWGYIQDETNRLSLVRRAHEYNHEYGLTLVGRAVPRLRPADPRTRFLEGFHNLLRACARFYREDNDTTVRAEAFGVLNALKEVHLLLSEGGDNQFRTIAPAVGGAGTWSAGAGFAGLAYGIQGASACGAPWIGAPVRAFGVVPGRGEVANRVRIDARGLSAGTHIGYVCVASDDPVQPKVALRVALTARRVDGSAVGVVDQYPQERL
jgi:hypothetical protein